jgi:hypothetical protein
VFKVLEISFHQGVELLHLGYEEMLALNRPVDHLVEAAGGGGRLLGGGIAHGELGFGRSLGQRERGAADHGEGKDCESDAQHNYFFHSIYDAWPIS